MNLFSARLLSIQDETPTVKRLIFDILEPGFEFKPGQWIDFYARIDGVQTVAGYSLTSSPLSSLQQIELAVKLSAHPVAEYLHRQAQPGQVFEISNGMGPVFYERRIGEQLVLIAGGIGITPLISMFRTARDFWSEVNLRLIYSDNDLKEYAYSQEIRSSCQQDPRLRADFTFTGLSEGPIPEWIQHRGRINAALFQKLELPELAHYFLCGPQLMLGQIGQDLQAMGVPRAFIHYEEW